MIRTHLLRALACAALTFAAASPLGCDPVEDRALQSASSEELCLAAEATDDNCEDVHGGDADECKPFDDVDEACEVNEVSDDEVCALADALDEACEALFGEDAEPCAEIDAVDESCADDEDEDDGA
ncbi:MAG: hypothetical protein KC636_02825 [Myxococcales bacterium]|nr:hypothetical protein [Myxococcales bacterium]